METGAKKDWTYCGDDADAPERDDERRKLFYPRSKHRPKTWGGVRHLIAWPCVPDCLGKLFRGDWLAGLYEGLTVFQIYLCGNNTGHCL